MTDYRKNAEGKFIIDPPCKETCERRFPKVPADCLRCRHYATDKGVFTLRCYECKRWYADQWEEK